MAKINKKAKVPAKITRGAKASSTKVAGADAPVKDKEEITPKLRSSAKPEEDKDEEVFDYLQQYQYKKVNNNPVLGAVAGALTDPDSGSKAERMKAFLLSQPKVTMLIPLPEGSDPKVLHSVTLNGYRLDFPTNTYIDVPVPVADVISKSNSQTLLALKQGQIGGDRKKEDALS